MSRLITAVCVAVAMTLCLAEASLAHKVNIFAYVDGNTVVSESGYSRTRRVHDGIVEVRDAASGKVVLSGSTDKDGRFAFDIPDEARSGKMDLRLLLKAGTGHQADWVVKYDEYGKDGEKGASARSDTGYKQAAPDAGKVADKAGKGVAVADVQAVVRRELEPVKQMLANMSQSGPGVTEVIGGIGYILGLFGMVAYMKSRKNK